MLRSRLKRAAGGPARALLDQRVLWLDSLVADRLGRAPVTVHDRLADLDRLARAQLQGLGFLELAGDAPGRELSELTAPVAGALNWAGGPEGYAAQAGLWFNPPVPVEHVAGGVEVLLVNERIVEQPWVLAQVGLEPRRVLDLGGAESTVALSLATLGHDVTVVDPRGYPVAHPNLTVAPERLQDHDAAPYDVAVALSAVEHFGLGHYEGGARSADDLDALRRLRGLAPRLVLTVPFAEAPSVDAFQRVYDRAGLDALLHGWTVEQRLAAWRVDRTQWRLGTCEEPLGERGVALVVAS